MNLEWCDAAYNNSFGNRRERIGKSLSRKVHQYALDGTFIREWPSAHEVQTVLWYNQAHISKCCLGKRKSAHGYVWRYAD